MGKAYFSRKAVSIEGLKENNNYNNETVEFVLEALIELERPEWDVFTEHLTDDYPFISQNSDLQYVDTNGIWHCIGIMQKGGGEIVIGNCEGFGYLRYSSYFSDATQVLADYRRYILSDKVVEQILEIRRKGRFNMFSLTDIMNEAIAYDFEELQKVLRYNKKLYVGFILTGEKGR